jgi:hypothetical protein
VCPAATSRATSNSRADSGDQGRPGGGQVAGGQGQQPPAVLDRGQRAGDGAGGQGAGQLAQPALGGVGDPGRGGVAAVAELGGGLVVAPQQGRLGQAPQRRREPLELGHALAPAEAGKVFCLSTGPSRESVLRIHERAGHPTTEIYQVPIEVD